MGIVELPGSGLRYFDNLSHPKTATIERHRGLLALATGKLGLFFTGERLALAGNA
ncbi:MAG: hypothetical protein ACRC8B_22480 [Aeromonas sobria]|uniref:hypothetical protein n=1 Tax=Aeromonas sobria TaxID=646 RepID=UPI003F2F5732